MTHQTTTEAEKASGIDECRKAFEKWMTDRVINIDMDADSWSRARYKYSHVEAMWEGFYKAWLTRPTQSPAPDGEVEEGAFKKGFIAGRLKWTGDKTYVSKDEAEAWRDYKATLSTERQAARNSKPVEFDPFGIKPATEPDNYRGAMADLSELVRVALTNPADLRGFIAANYPAEFAKHAKPAAEQAGDALGKVCTALKTLQLDPSYSGAELKDQLSEADIALIAKTALAAVPPSLDVDALIAEMEKNKDLMTVCCDAGNSAIARCIALVKRMAGRV